MHAHLLQPSSRQLMGCGSFGASRPSSSRDSMDGVVGSRGGAAAVADGGLLAPAAPEPPEPAATATSLPGVLTWQEARTTFAATAASL